MTAAVLVGRVGGLAAALGVGVVISLASSAPAAAEPADSRSDARSATRSESDSNAGSATRRGADPERSGNRGPRSVRAAASIAAPVAAADTRPAPTTRSNRGTTVSPSRPSVPVAESLLAPVPQEPRSEVPASAAVTSVAAPRVASAGVVAPVPSSGVPAAVGAVASPATAATSLAGSVQSLFFDPRGRRITFLKGTHFAIPSSFAFFTRRVTGTGTFTTDTVYDLKDEDQFDWNKFTGIAFTPLEPDRNSVMVGWRYNLTSREFEIAPFYNVDKKRILPNEQTEVISVPAGQTFDYDVDYTGVRISYGGKTVYKPYPEGLKPNIWTAARVSGWFGGNETAPRPLSYYLNIAR